MDCSTPGCPVLYCIPSLLRLTSIQAMMPFNHYVLCHPLFLLLSVFPRIRLFSSKSALHIRWPKYWSFSFSISPSIEYSGLISFRTDWFDPFLFYLRLKPVFLHPPFFVISSPVVFPVVMMDMRVGPQRRPSAEELMLLVLEKT